MSSEQITPPPDEQEDSNIKSPETVVSEPGAPEASAVNIIEHPYLHFSSVRWISTGVVRIFYRAWTRVAARLFPENSKGEELARTLNIPLPDKLNMSWINNHIAVGGRVRPEEI